MAVEVRTRDSRREEAGLRRLASRGAGRARQTSREQVVTSVPGGRLSARRGTELGKSRPAQGRPSPGGAKEEVKG